MSLVGHQGAAGCQPEQQEGASRAVVKRSSRRWGGSDLYSGHCTKLPHLIGHLRCLREELASSTGMEGVRERTGGKVIVGTLHTYNTHTHTSSKPIWLYPLSSLGLTHSPEPSLHFSEPSTLFRLPTVLALTSSLPGPPAPGGRRFLESLILPFPKSPLSNMSTTSFEPCHLYLSFCQAPWFISCQVNIC